MDMHRSNDAPNSSSAVPPPNRKAQCVATILQHRIETGVSPHTLVVGCGSGTEAATLARVLKATVIGIDNNAVFDPSAGSWADLRYGDATALEFPDGSFDLVYSYHVLEHIPQWQKALSEMRRVLKPGGWCFIGTPNRSRLVGYLGAEHTGMRQKLTWNYDDWRARLRGRFRNEHGAHAGFSEPELANMLRGVFPFVTSITRSYYHELYPEFRWVVETLWVGRAYRLVMPAIYFLCRKTVETG